MTLLFEFEITSKEFARILYLMKTSKKYDKSKDEDLIWKIKLISQHQESEEKEEIEDSKEEE